MKTTSNMPPPATKRQRVQLALDRFCIGQANESDFAVFRDRRYMIASSADQACRFIEAATGRSVPFDVYVIWASILRERHLMSIAGRRSGAMHRSRSKLSQERVQVLTTVHHAEEDER